MTVVINREQELKAFAKRIARRWKNYFSIDGLIPGINPTKEQKQVVQSSEKQLIIRGSAGSGKSLMLAYRLIKIIDQAETKQKILYVTFNQTLIEDTKKRLNHSERYNQLKEKHDIIITTYHDLVRNILINECGYKQFKRIPMTQQSILSHETDIVAKVQVIMDRFKESLDYEDYPKLFKTHSAKFLQEEFFWMKANGITKREQYLNCQRTGRGNNPQVRMKQRPTIFYLFEKYNEFMKTNFKFPQFDMEDYALLLLNELNTNSNKTFNYDHIFVDEFQDLQPMQIKSLVQLTNNSITLVGDDRQRIYRRSPVSYRDLNLEVNHRTNLRLSKNFRSTKQIMNLASGLEFIDVENVREDDQDFFREGPKPKIRHFKSARNLARAIIREIKLIHKNDPGKTIAVIHRYTRNELNQEGNLREKLNREFDVVSISQYGKRFDYSKVKKPVFFTDPFDIKGLEFDYVFITHFDRIHYPSQERVKDLNDKYGGKKWSDPNYKNDYDIMENDEKKVLYVACSRAKEQLFLYYYGKNYKRISQFVRDFNTIDYDSNFPKTPYKKDR